MGWFTKSPKRKKATVPEEKEKFWTLCAACKAHIFKEEWESNLKVCPKCNFHERIPSHERLAMLIDADTFRELDAEVTTTDPLKFVDGKGSYADKAEDTKEKTSMNEAVLTGRGKINGIPVVIAIMDFRFLGGSLGSGTGEKILRATRYALKEKLPCIIVSASGGARMHEGIISLMQMAKTCAGVARLQQARIPYISVLTDPTTGGVSASYAMMGDINIAEPGALIGFAGRRVIEETIKQQLPPDFQTAEYVLKHGFVDRIVPRKEMKEFLSSVLQFWQRR
jgi:acetyl-CoA carboxylase carboxyl transferase subunit beta